MSQATLFIDDQDSQIKFLCPSQKQRVAGSYYKNTWSTVQSPDCSRGWFEYSFYGTGIHVPAAAAQAGTSYSVKIDDGEFQSSSGAFTSPVLSDGQHTITYATGTGKAPPAFDYLTVAAGPTTPLDGKTLVVDDSESSVVYSGDWSTSSPVPLSFDYSTSLYKNTAHWSSKVGDSLQFRFVGSSVSVLGIVANTSGGNITATYTLDGVVKTQAIAKDTLDYQPMVELFHADIQPGEHTLIVNLTDIQGPRALGIDLITYNASFPSLGALGGTANVGTTTDMSGHSNTPNWAPKVGIAIGVIGSVMVTFAIGLVLWKKHRLAKFKGSKLPY